MDPQLPQDPPAPVKKKRGSYSKKTKPEATNKQGAFLEAYRTTVNMRQSLKAAKIDYRVFQRWFANDPEFRAQWDEIQDAAGQTLEDECVRRAVEGCKRAIYYRGARVYTGEGKNRRPVYELEFSDQLLIHLLRRFRPSLYRDNQHVEHSGSINLVERLSAARARLIDLETKRSSDPSTGTSG